MTLGRFGVRGEIWGQSAISHQRHNGSVRIMSYSIDLEIYRQLGNRQDGLAIDAKAY